MPVPDIGAAMTSLKKILEGLNLFADVQLGYRSASLAGPLIASILFMPVTKRRPTTGQYELEFNLVIEMWYRTDGDVGNAETQIAVAYMTVVDTLEDNKRLVDPDTNQATVRTSDVLGPAAYPDYENLARQEQRVLPVFLHCYVRNLFEIHQ